MKYLYRLIVVFCILSISCGIQSQISASTAQPTIPSQASRLSATAPHHIPETVTMITIGQLNVRACPSTACEVMDEGLAVLDAGAEVEIIGGMITDDTVIDCNRWYKIVWRGDDGYVCAGWLK